MKITNKLILFLILLVAITLRFYNYQNIPFTHDEFSALSRTNFNSFSELIDQGVKVDGHPAGIQVFLYYWTKLAGKSEVWVKLPFMLMGIASVVLVYLIAKMWYNETVALLSTSFVASIQFSIVYSQIARPYISGLFFAMLMVYFWSKIILHPTKRFYTNAALFVLSAALCAYNHHFSLLFAIIVGVSGLFLIKKEYLIKYVVFGILIFILYIPHLGIFFHQLSMGGVGGWLGKPTNDFFFRYLAYLFHFSYLWLVLLLVGLFATFYKFKRDKDYVKKLILFLLWFTLPFIIGFLYSKYVNAVLQFSVLIFSFPFLYFALFGHIKLMSAKVNFMLVALVLLVNSYTLIAERDHYNLFYNYRFEKILTDYSKVQKEYSNTLSIIDSHPMISQYYIDKWDIDTNFVWFNSFGDISEFNKFLKNNYTQYDYLFLGCTSNNDPLSVPVIQQYFPTMIHQQDFVAGNTYLFSKAKVSDTGVKSLLDFDGQSEVYWLQIDESRLIDTASYSGTHSYVYSSENEWGLSYTGFLSDLIEPENNFVDVSVKLKPFGAIDDVILVSTLEAGEKSLHWQGTPVSKFVVDSTLNEGWFTALHSIKLSDINLNYRNIKLKVYIWNMGKRTFLIDDFKISVRKGNPVLYGMEERHF